MHPISQERADWLRSRLRVVEVCIPKAQATVMSFHSGGVQFHEWQQVLTELKVEKLKIQLELAVLKDMVTP